MSYSAILESGKADFFVSENFEINKDFPAFCYPIIIKIY